MSGTLNEALRQLEAVEANLAKLEKLWEEMLPLIPEGIAFGGDIGFEEKSRAWHRLVKSMPAIDGWKLPNHLMDLDTIAQARFDALELGDPESAMAVERAVEAPGVDLREYRFRFDAKRRELIRKHIRTLLDEVDTLLHDLAREADGKDPQASLLGEDWDRLWDRARQIDTLLGSSVDRPPRWGDLFRHLHFGLVHDLEDIMVHDWPAVKGGIEKALYDGNEPLPVEVTDIGELVAAKPGGPVAVRLAWETVSDEEFERLIFCLIADASGYENPQWLTKTRAPDRGRDLSVERVHQDALGGVKRQRVIIQCKHWLSQSVQPKHVTTARDQMELWEPPPIDVLVIATTGRFTTDAVDLIEKHNNQRKRPEIEMWPESHIELLVGSRPHLVAEFHLR